MKRELKTMDGNQAAAHVAYAYTEVAAIYPITPSSTMAEYTDEWALEGRKNIWGQPVKVTEMQSEAGAAGAVHGSLIAGALTTTFTASQGLLLMIPNIYRIAGELLPGVFHVAARTIATHALSIFGDHSDIYACRQTGAAFLAHTSVQEVMDLSPVAHLAAISGRIPFINFFDGFRTSHEMQKIQIWDYETLKEFLDLQAVQKFREHSLHPDHVKIMGSAQNPDIFFQNREACNPYYDALPTVVEKYMQRINEKLGTDYDLFNYVGAPDAEHVIIAMGSVCETIEETIKVMNTKDGSSDTEGHSSSTEGHSSDTDGHSSDTKGQNSDTRSSKFGLIKVRLYRPFSAKHLLKALPETVSQITVLDRTKEPGSAGEPLYLDVVAALHGSAYQHIPVFSGRYGLSSKDTAPGQILSVLRNTTKQRFTIGITDDVTHLSLPVSEQLDPLPSDIYSCKFWGLGGDGTVSANKSSVKIIGNHTDMHAQAYFEYDSKKSRGLTISHLRFGKSEIHAPYLVEKADFVACHNPVYMHKYHMVQEVKAGGSFLLNCYFKEQDLEEYLPAQAKRYIAENRIHLYIIDAIRIGKEIGLNNKISTILQAAFFKVTGILPIENAAQLMKNAAEISYRKKGDDIVQMNFAAIDRGISDVREVQYPDSWRQACDEFSHTPPDAGLLQNPLSCADHLQNQPPCADYSQNQPPCADHSQNQLSCVESSSHDLFDTDLLPDRPEILNYVINLQKTITRQQGNELPVSAFLPYADGAFVPGTTAHERRNAATEIPVWIPENCIQCNRCAYVCPHAVIRPAIMTEEEKAAAPEGMKSLPFMGMPPYSFSITVSEVDCTGCGSCAGVCPGKQGKKALEMTPIHEKEECQQYFDYGKSLPLKPEVLEKFKENTVKGSQLRRPLLEFHGACAGCGETTYPKLVTQLFGERMYIANATGCSSIWANSSPSTAYTVTPEGKGPAWSNSLFEDGAEFGFGMLLAQKTIRERLKTSVENLCNQLSKANVLPDLYTACQTWLETFEDGRNNSPASNKLMTHLTAALQEIERGNIETPSPLQAEAPASLSPTAHTAKHAIQTTDIYNASVLASETDIRNASALAPETDIRNVSALAPVIADLLTYRDYFSKKSQWVFGGDGFAYDIGFGGLDHVLSSGQDINILVLDTEVYSNTGGQASKATPTGSTAKFASGGKRTRKKDLAAMLMTYGDVYVAQIAMGADYNQTLKAILEAESYHGPSLIIAYAPCISHGVKAGMGCSQHEEAKAVETGYWHLFRYNPELLKQGKNPFILDSKAPTLDYEEFLAGETRYTVLEHMDPEKAKELFAQAQSDAREKYERLLRLAAFYEPHS